MANDQSVKKESSKQQSTVSPQNQNNRPFTKNPAQQLTQGQYNRQQQNPAAVERIVAEFLGLSPQQQLDFIRGANLAVLHTFSAKPGQELRVNFVKNSPQLFPVINAISHSVSSIQRFRDTMAGGLVEISDDAVDLLKQLSVKGFDEKARPQEIKVFEPIVTACNELSEHVFKVISDIRKGIPDRPSRNVSSRSGGKSEDVRAEKKQDATQVAPQPAKAKAKSPKTASAPVDPEASVTTPLVEALGRDLASVAEDTSAAQAETPAEQLTA